MVVEGEGEKGAGSPVQGAWPQISLVEARMVFSVLKWTLFCFCRLILLVRGHFLSGGRGDTEVRAP